MDDEDPSDGCIEICTRESPASGPLVDRVDHARQKFRDHPDDLVPGGEMTRDGKRRYRLFVSPPFIDQLRAK